MSVAELAGPAPTLELELEPVRVGVKLTVGLPAGADTLAVWRVSTATLHEAYVRGCVALDVADQTTAIVYDWEVPLGVELVYYAQATVAGVTSDVAVSAPLVIDDERDWLVDLARPTNTMPIVVEALPELSFEGPVGVHRVLDRRDPVLTTGALWTPSGSLVFVTETRLERDRARTILGDGIAFLLRTPPDRGVGNLFLGVLGMREQRASRLALHDDRRFVVDVVQVARPDPSIFTPLAPLTYRVRLAEWPLYSDVAALGVTYQELAYTFPDSGGGVADPVSPWLPDDV